VGVGAEVGAAVGAEVGAAVGAEVEDCLESRVTARVDPFTTTGRCIRSSRLPSAFGPKAQPQRFAGFAREQPALGHWALRTLAHTGSNNNGAEHALGLEAEAVGAPVGAEVESAESYCAMSAVQLGAPPRGRSLRPGGLPDGGTLLRQTTSVAGSRPTHRPIDLSRDSATP
jgi:hypothetical protein